MKVVRLGIIGLGYMGQNHLRVLSNLRNVQIVWAYDTNETVSNAVSRNLEISTISDLDQGFKIVDGVLIASPTPTHFEYLKKAIGKVANIFVEKPFTSTLSEALEIMELIENNPTNLMVGFIERYNPSIRVALDLLEESSIINVDLIRTNKVSARIHDTDLIHDLMIHDIDIALLMNGPVSIVEANGKEVDDMIGIANATLHHENGAITRLQASKITDKKERLMKITTDNCYIDCDLLRKEVLVYKQSRIIDEKDKPYTIRAVQEQVNVPLEEALQTELKDFLQLCSNEKTSPVFPNVHSALSVQKICNQILKVISKNSKHVEVIQ